MRCEIIVDKLTGHATEGKLGKFHIECGDRLGHGDSICTIESGKGTIQCTSNQSGKIIEFIVSEGENVKIGDVIGYIESDGLTEESFSKTPVSTGYSFGLAKPRQEDAKPELLVVGGGPGGYVAAIRGAQLGLDVMLIEKDELGGTCLNYGCIPTKTLAHTAHVMEVIKDSYEYGIETEAPKLNIGSAIARKNRVVKNLTDGIGYLLEKSGVRVIRGEAKVIDSGQFEVRNSKTDLSIKPKNTILATGSSPFKLPIEGSELPGVITSKELLEITTLPASITIVGGGVIGMEFAFIMKSFGVSVTVIEYQDDILSILDEDVVDVILNAAMRKNINVITGVCAKKIVKTIDETLILEFVDGDETRLVSSEMILMATGRKPNLDSLDLDVLGVELNDSKNGVQVNSKLETTKDGIYAIGDLTNIVQLAHVASHQGMVAAQNASGNPSTMEYDNVPSAIFTDPEVATIGINEKEAKSRNLNIAVSKFSFAGNGKALAMNQSEGFVKLISDTEKDLVIGGTIIGVHATDMLPAIVHLIENEIPVEEAIHTIYAHPTAAEGIHEALLGLKGKMIHA